VQVLVPLSGATVKDIDEGQLKVFTEPGYTHCKLPVLLAVTATDECTLEKSRQDAPPPELGEQAKVIPLQELTF
jgi:hypothetical protein